VVFEVSLRKPSNLINFLVKVADLVIFINQVLLFDSVFSSIGLIFQAYLKVFIFVFFIFEFAHYA
jgi:hypothetical protein